MRRHRRRLFQVGLVLSGVLVLVYAMLPVIAGGFAWGDRRGPVIYPQGLHEALYIIGWEESGREGKPRVLAGEKGSRPWFYGF